MTPSPDYSRDGIDLYCGDCLEILPQLPGGCVDAVVTDPPYGILVKFGSQRTSSGGTRCMEFTWDRPGVVGTTINGLEMAFERCRESAACFVWCGFDSASAYAAPAREAGFTVKPAAWVKTCPPPAGKGNWWPSAFELAYYGYRAGAWFGDTDARRRNVWTFDSYRHGQPGKVDHPTQKPLALLERIVQSIVPPGGVALDPYFGSGTTGVACVKLGRKFIGIESEPKYFDIAVKRIEQAFEEQAMFQGIEPASGLHAMNISCVANTKEKGKPHVRLGYDD